MISIVTAYYNRRKLFIRTLQSLLPYYGEIDFELIAVDDGSDEDQQLEDLIEKFPFLNIVRLEKHHKWYMNPCIPFNLGFEKVKGEKVIIQNPECYHFDPILKYVEKNLSRNKYLSFGCFSLDKQNTDDDHLFFDRNNIENLMLNGNHTVKIDGGLGWYNHSEHRPSALHFCTAIMREDLLDLGGFDPRFAWGHGFDDDEFIHRVRVKRMKIKFIDQFRVLHQNHYIKPVGQQEKYNNPFAERNESILINITKKSNVHRANYLQINNFKQNTNRNLFAALKIFYFALIHKKVNLLKKY